MQRTEGWIKMILGQQQKDFCLLWSFCSVLYPALKIFLNNSEGEVSYAFPRKLGLQHKRHTWKKLKAGRNCKYIPFTECLMIVTVRRSAIHLPPNYSTSFISLLKAPEDKPRTSCPQMCINHSFVRLRSFAWNGPPWRSFERVFDEYVSVRITDFMPICATVRRQTADLLLLS